MPLHPSRPARLSLSILARLGLLLWLCGGLRPALPFEVSATPEASEAGCGVHQDPAAAPATAAQIDACYSLDQLQQAADYLLVLVERAQPAPAILPCDPDPATARGWLGGPLHALIDRHRRALEAEYGRDPGRVAPGIAGCHTRCTCNAYRHVLEQFEVDLSANPVHRSNRDRLEEEMRGVGPAQSLACASRAQWFCGSQLRSFLQAP